MTPAERVVVEAACRLVKNNPYGIVQSDQTGMDLLAAVDALLAERANLPSDALIEITWGQVVEGDQIYRAISGAYLPMDTPGGKWFTVTRSGPLAGTHRVRVNAEGIGRPIQPEAKKPVMVKRGATGHAVDTLGALLWSGQNTPGIRDIAAAIINDPVSAEGEDAEPR